MPIAATPAASAAFFATRLTFGRILFFVVLAVFVLVVLLGFDLVRARVAEDLALVRLTLFFMVRSSMQMIGVRLTRKHPWLRRTKIALSECGHRVLARFSIAVCRVSVLVMAEG